MRKIIIFFLQIFFGIITKREIIGMENIPDEGPVVATANHIGIFDGIMIPSVPKLARHPNLIVVVAEKYARKPVFKWAVKHLNFMFIDRFNPDVPTLKKVIRNLLNDGLLVIAPEGTRSPNAALIEGKSGAAYLAAKTNASIIPVAITGSQDGELGKRLKRLKRMDVKIIIGEPYHLPPLPKGNRDEFLKTATDEIMCQIAALLPEPYRGIYADHPRLKEILAA